MNANMYPSDKVYYVCVYSYLVVQAYLCTVTSETSCSSINHTAMYSLLLHLVHYKHP